MRRQTSRREFIHTHAASMTEVLIMQFLVTCLALSPQLAVAGDWPTWRHDAQRSASAANDHQRGADQLGHGRRALQLHLHRRRHDANFL